MAVLSSSTDVSRPRLAAPTTALAVAAALALCLSAALRPDEVAGGPVVCPFRLATGLPCPGCGMTRAWVFMSHGRVADAVAANPFVMVAMPAALALVVAVCAAGVRHRPPPDLTRAARATITKVVLVAWLGFALVRLVAVLTGHATP